MTRKEKNTFGLLTLVLVILAFFALASPMFRFGLPRVFMHDWLGIDPGSLSFHMHHGTMSMVRMLPLALVYLLWAGVVVWVYKDAERRGLNGLLWALFVLVGNVIGLIIYLILRGTSPERSEGSEAPLPPTVPDAACPDCGGAVRPEYVACPYCGRPVEKA